jgi:hypothetical protein
MMRTIQLLELQVMEAIRSDTRTVPGAGPIRRMVDPGTGN